MRQVVTSNGILQRGGNGRLTNDSAECVGAIFPGRYDIMFHAEVNQRDPKNKRKKDVDNPETGEVINHFMCLQGFLP